MDDYQRMLLQKCRGNVPGMEYPIHAVHYFDVY